MFEPAFRVYELLLAVQVLIVPVQHMVHSLESFVTFSSDSVSSGDEIYIEVAIGKSETLASAAENGLHDRLPVELKIFDVGDISFAS